MEKHLQNFYVRTKAFNLNLKKVLLILVPLLFAFFNAFSQRSDSEMNGKVKATATDYELKAEWGNDLPWINDGDTHGWMTIKGTDWITFDRWYDYNNGYRSYPAGNSTTQYGPNKAYDLEVYYHWGKDCSGCTLKWGWEHIMGTTPKIKAPQNVNAVLAANKIEISWVKKTSIPDSYVNYKIRRKPTNGGAYLDLATIEGHVTQYTDNTVLATGDYVYSVQTILSGSAPSNWNHNASAAEDPSESNIVSYYNANLVIDAEQKGRITLKWNSFNSLKGIDGLILYRDGVELTDLSKTTKVYNDVDVVPGIYYNYTIGLIQDDDASTPAINLGYRSNVAQGRSLPNGKISGYVKGKTGAGVPGVVITAESKTAINDNKTSEFYSYTSTTTEDGYYEITDVFYGTGVDYVLTPNMPGYIKNRFDPKTLTRKLNQDGANLIQVNFTDTASFAISGKVYFTTIKKGTVDYNLPLPDAEIWLDGKSTNVKTKADGSYSINIITGGNYLLQAKYKNHAITAANSTSITQSVQVNNLVTDIDFEDKTTDTLKIQVAGPCNTAIGENATVSLKSKANGVNGAKLQYDVPYTIRSYDFKQGIAYENQKEKGVLELVLPATNFTVEVTNVLANDPTASVKNEYFKKEYGIKDINLAFRDTLQKIKQDTSLNFIKADTLKRPDGSIYKITPSRTDTIIKADTTYIAKAKSFDFIYHKDIQVILNNGNDIFPEKVLFKSLNVSNFLVTQNDKYPVNIKLKESYSYLDDVTNCDLDTGRIYIYDAIGDKIDRQDFSLDTLNGSVKYNVKVGAPVLESPYTKSIQIVGVVGGRTANVIVKAAVEGQRARNATFVTKTPEIPLFILHDPPGDKSYASISKGTTISKSLTTQFASSVGGGAWLDLKIGAGLSLPFVGSVGGSIHIQTDIQSGRDKTESSTTNFTTTFTESFSTSSEETLVGNDGDVYVGGSMNMIYALTDVLEYDKLKQDMKRDTSLAINNEGFATTFAYTEKHIKNTLLAQLRTLYSLTKSKYDDALQKQQNGDNTISPAVLEELKRAQAENKASIDAWNGSLAKNEENRKKAKAIVLQTGPSIVGGNISLSAGVIYDNSLTTDVGSISSTDISIYLNNETRFGLYNKTGDFNEIDGGGVINFRLNWNTSEENSIQKTTTTSYHLEDNDIGDFFSINLAEDKQYGTPVFTVVSGSSSCPHEETTQFRHLPSMQINGANEQRNVPSDQAAKFQVTIANRSESDETVEYAVKLDPKSNLDGARVLVGGVDVTNGQATYYIPTGKNFTLPVEVFKGPLSSTYENLSLAIFSTCENTLDDISEENVAKPSVKLNAYFQNKCSEIDLFIPGDNWVVNQSNNNQLRVAFSKYDASGSSPLTSVSLQYRKLNTDYDNGLWQTVNTLPKASLKDKYYDYAFDVSGLSDGNYQIRAIAVCQGVDVNYSPVYTGIIDRKSAVAFGVPSPATGLLTQADIIGITFNKSIIYNDDTNPVIVKLKRKDNGLEIPATFVSDGKNFHIKTSPENLIDSYENVELTAIIKNLIDAGGNKVADSISWSFVVNLSPVYWLPNNIELNATENQQASFKANLVNKSALNQTVLITKYPSWLTPSVTNTKIVPQGQQSIDFSVNSSLNTGIYTDTVVAEVAGKKQFLYVTVNVLRNSPNWTVNPANYKYNMSFTTQFSIDQSDGLTSKDIRDKMGVFVGNECRGVANIEYNRDLDKYIAYITAYSNVASNEQLTVHFWDAYPGLEYQGKERLNFVPNGNLGNLQNPFIIHPEGIYQTIPLKNGWTWVSLNVQNSDMTLKKVLANLTPKEGDIIKTLSNNNAYSQYNKELGWVGTLTDIDLYNSYMIYVSKPDTIRILGNFINQAANVKLVKGWSWTGYPMAINMDVNTYLKNFNPADGSQIVSQEEFAQYNASSKTWSGSLKYLRPGKGYKFYTDTDGFTVPVMPYIPTVDPGAETKQQNLPPVNDPAAPVIVNNSNTSVTSTVNNTSVSTVNMENNMSVTSVINQGGTVVNNTTNRYETSIYVENKLVNIVNQVNLSNGNSIGFLPINGDKTDEGKQVTIKVYDKTEKKEYTAKVKQPIIQKGDEITGTVTNPVQLILEGNANVKSSNSISLAKVNIGQEFTYQLKVENLGPDLAVNLNLKDLLPDGFDYVSSDGDLVYNAATKTFSVSKLNFATAAQQVYNIKLKANKVMKTTLGNGSVNINNDTDLSNNNFAALAIEVVDRRADVTVITSVSRSQLNKSEETIYTLKIKNNGSDIANNLTLIDVLPAGLEYISATGGITYNTNNRTLSANKAQLKAGEEAVFTVILKATSSGNYQLGNGEINADNDNNLDYDNNKINVLQVTVTDNKVDLLVTNKVDKNKVSKGEQLDYTIMVKNNGPDVAINIDVTDALPKYFDFISSNLANYDPITRKISAHKDQLLLGEEAQFIIAVKPNAFGELIIGNGNVTVYNETDATNNVIKPIAVVAADVRADDNRIVIPELFTPNGDGINDLFVVVGLNEFFVKNSLVIYNKNYNVVYRKDNYQNDWNGNALPMGSYGYLLKVVDNTGKEKTYKGYISIVY